MENSQHNKVKSILPQPFDWCYIPAGKVKITPNDYSKHYGYLKEATDFDVPAFYMAQYPVTNVQFKEFIKAEGYKQERWWTKEGWQHVVERSWKQPRLWDWSSAKAYGKFDEDEQPVVGISWYEALAFCWWLSEVCEAKISLPSDQAWQRAAQGDDERKYPWGNEFDTSKANTYQSRIKRTSSVTAYPDGASPYGVMDMVGNVWEWCMTDFKTGSHELVATDRVLRGSSHMLSSNDDGLASRDHTKPSDWYNTYGFRICAK